MSDTEDGTLHCIAFPPQTRYFSHQVTGTEANPEINGRYYATGKTVSKEEAEPLGCQTLVMCLEKCERETVKPHLYPPSSNMTEL